MFFIVVIFSILAFVKTLGFAIYEYQDKSNKLTGIVIGALSVFALVRTCFSCNDEVN